MFYDIEENLNSFSFFPFLPVWRGPQNTLAAGNPVILEKLLMQAQTKKRKMDPVWGCTCEGPWCSASIPQRFLMDMHVERPNPQDPRFFKIGRVPFVGMHNGRPMMLHVSPPTSFYGLWGGKWENTGHSASVPQRHPLGIHMTSR